MKRCLIAGCTLVMTAWSTAAALSAPPPAPVCGDVNDSSTITTTDALLVLKKGVGQAGVVLSCSAYDGAISSCVSDRDACTSELSGCSASYSQCQTQLTTCQSQPVCGNDTVEYGEECEAHDLAGASCKWLGFADGTLGCSAGCTFDTSACYSTRFDTSGGTIIDHKTGLEWEKKDSADEVIEDANPHDVDNSYAWSASLDSLQDGPAFTDFLAKLNSATSSDGVTTTGCYAGHCDWRLPTIEELGTILNPDCFDVPCVIDPVFLPAPLGAVWSISTLSTNVQKAWAGNYGTGAAGTFDKTVQAFTRAVRGGSPGTMACTGTSVLGYCWFLGNLGDSCNDTCTAHSLTYDIATKTIAGSSGTDANCQAVLDAMHAPGTGLDFPSYPYTNGIGCSVDYLDERARIVWPETEPGIGADGLARACACK